MKAGNNIMPMVSVIIPVYKSEPYLRQCLDSLVNQTLRDIEIICINDGSPDNSLTILNEYAGKDSRVKVYSKENEGKGAASARNYGLDKATAKYLSILDSDDYFELDMFEKLVRHAEETNADIVICDAQGFDHKTGQSTFNAVAYAQSDLPDKQVFSVKDYPKTIFQISATTAWNCLFRRDLVEKHKLRFQRIIMTDDLYFSFSCRVLAERISVVDEKLIHYRINSGTSQSDNLTKYPDSAYPAYIEFKNSLEQWGLYDTVKQSLINAAVKTFRGAYDRINEYGSFERFHEQLKNEIFPTLEITGKTEDYFYDPRSYEWYHLVTDNSAGEAAFKAARGYSAPMTTGILRFQLPQNMLATEKIELKRDSIVSKYYYAQLLFLGLETSVHWID
jgi:glycosyltransferase involved in cell wall biosynthesis